jgi:hypothetical protein
MDTEILTRSSTMRNLTDSLKKSRKSKKQLIKMDHRITLLRGI